MRNLKEVCYNSAMGQPLNNARHNPTAQAVGGLVKGQVYGIDIDDRAPLSLLTFGFLISDQYSNCGPAITTNFSACPTVATSFSACPSVSTIWSASL